MMFDRFANLSRLLAGWKRLFGQPPAPPEDPDIEVVDAEPVDPSAPIESGLPDEQPTPLTLAERWRGWWQRRKQAIINFFVPPPVMVPAQLKTPEVDLEQEAAKPPLKGQMIYLMIIAFFIVAVVWASLAEIDELVRAEGEIVPSESVQVVQSRLPGSVVAIHAELDNRVSKGDILFEVEDEDVRANYDDNEIHRLTSLAAIQRLEAESTGAADISFPATLEAEAPEIVAQERKVFNSRRQALRSEEDVIRQEIESLRRAITARLAAARQARVQIDTIKRQIRVTEEEFQVIKPLVDQGFEPKTALLNIEKEMLATHSRLNDARAREEEARQEAERMESDLVTQNRRLKSLSDRFRADAETQLVEVRTRAAQTLARLDALKEKVAFTAIRAPVDGIITAVHVNTIGAVVDGGAMMAEIVPIEDEVTVRARVNTDDVSKIAPGQKVFVSVSAYDMSRYGRLEGIVDKVAANSTQQENLPPYFVTLVKVPDPIFPETGIVPEIVPGTPVVVDMVAGKRTVMGYILSPINRASTIVFREK